jgi:prostaglandin-endoperoxide synthase 2
MGIWDSLLGGAVNLATKIPGIAKRANRFAINSLVESTDSRPYPFSLWSPAVVAPGDAAAGYTVDSARYTSWPSLTDRSFTNRHLPPAPEEYTRSLPPVEQVMNLFERRSLIPCPRSSILFPFFAQWFTDSFLRTDPVDRRKNTSNHGIDLCQIYGLRESTADLLRSRTGGQLRSEKIGAQEFPEKLYAPDGSVKPHFRALPYVNILEPMLQHLAPFALRPDRRNAFYATGLERGNSTIGYTAVSTVFLREHNRLCREFAARYGWDDDRLFQTARNVNLTQLLKIIIEDYINHLSNAPIKFRVEVGFAEKRRWYRENHMALEFNLLYRWHGLVPDTFELAGDVLQHEEFRFNNRLLEQHGVEPVIRAASRQRAGKITLRNAPTFLREAERASLTFGRQFHLQSYNDYRKCFGKKPVRSFEELAGDNDLARELGALYTRGVDQVELVVGLLAENYETETALGDLTQVMVAADAFSQALTNPLLSQNVFGEDTFSEIGLQSIEETDTFEDIVKRNAENEGEVLASFEVR